MLNEALRRWGIPPMVAITTQECPVANEEARAREIMSWARAHQHACASGWVALDDMDLMVAAPPAFPPVLPPGHFVRTNGTVGLTKDDALLAIRLLGGPNKAAPKLPPPHPNATQPFSMTQVNGEPQSA